VLRGTVPAGATQAVVVARANAEGATPGVADIRLYSAWYSDGTSSRNKVLNSPFLTWSLSPWDSSGSTPGTVSLVVSDAGYGQMIRMQAAEHQQVFLDSDRFSVVVGSGYEFRVEFAVPATSQNIGYLAVAFLDAAGSEIGRDRIPLITQPAVTRTVVTDSRGWYEASDGSLTPGTYSVVATAPGDLTSWPAFATNISGY